jgi:hemerythrin-like domain-containing protein
MFNSALNIIYDEHRSLASVVKGLRFLGAVYRLRPESADFGLLRAIVFYLDEFPQKRHHPKENAYLFPRLQLRTRTADSLIAELRRQHDAGGSYVDALRKTLDRFASGHACGAADFSTAVENFADDILRHMALEESALIPLARRHLSGEDWVEISVAFGENGDPRFIADAERDYAGLFSRIMALAPNAAAAHFGTDHPGF